MAKKEIWKDNLIRFLGTLGGVGGVGYLIFQILMAPISEAKKYFAVTIVLFIILLIYIELVVKKK